MQPTNLVAADPLQRFIEVCSRELAKIASTNDRGNGQPAWERHGYENADAHAKHLAAHYTHQAKALADAVRAAGLEFRVAPTAEPKQVLETDEDNSLDVSRPRFKLPKNWYTEVLIDGIDTSIPGIYKWEI